MGWSSVFRPARNSSTVAMVLAIALSTGWAQERGQDKAPAGSVANSLRELKAQVLDLQEALAEMRAQTARYRAETLEMRRELQATRAQLASSSQSLPASTAPPVISAGPLATHEGSAAPVASSADQSGEQPLAKLQEDQELLSAKVDEQHQAKVESASKYPVRLSGIVLLNVFSNRGSVDNQDFPTLVQPRGRLDSGGSFGATMRQSQLGLEVFGPRLGGAKTMAAVRLDFAGGFANTLDGVTSGLVRLRTATLRFDWQRTSIVAGQDALFLSPHSPTSLASLAVPALSYAGNLWSWTPQIRVEHRVELSDRSSFTLQGGILDPLTGEPTPTSSQFLRTAQGGERSRQPGYGARVAWSHGASEQKATLGVGGYYSREYWGFGRKVDGWACTTDWSVPFSRGFSLTGEFYCGRAIGGLAGGIGRSVLWSGPLTDPTTPVRGLNSMGGWTQLKFQPTTKLEFNAAFGQDNPLARDMRFFAVTQSFFYPTVARNRASLCNFIYRPRSDLLFSAEYRRLRTFDIRGISRTADHINLMMGVLF